MDSLRSSGDGSTPNSGNEGLTDWRDTAKADLSRLDPWLLPLTFLACLAAVGGAWATEDYLDHFTRRGRFYQETENWQFLPTGFALGTILFLACTFALSPANLVRRSVGFLSCMIAISVFFLLTLVWPAVPPGIGVFGQWFWLLVTPLATAMFFFWSLNTLLFPLRLFNPGRRNRLSRELMRDVTRRPVGLWIAGALPMAILWVAFRWGSPAIRPLLFSQILPGLWFGGCLYLILASIAMSTNRIIGFMVGLLVFIGSSFWLCQVVDQTCWLLGSNTTDLKAWQFTTIGGMLAWLVALVLLAVYQRLPHLSRWKSFEGLWEKSVVPAGRPPQLTRRQIRVWVSLTLGLLPVVFVCPLFLAENPITLVLTQTHPMPLPPAAPTTPTVQRSGVAVSRGPKIITLDESTPNGLNNLESQQGILVVKVNSAQGLARALRYIANIRYLEIDGERLRPDDFPTPENAVFCSGQVTLKNMFVESRQLAGFTAPRLQLTNCRLAKDVLNDWEPTDLGLLDCTFDPDFLDRWNRDFNRHYLFMFYSSLENIDLNESQMRAILKWNSLGLINAAADPKRILKWLGQQNYSVEFIKQAKTNLVADVDLVDLVAGYRKSTIIRPFCYGGNLPWPANAEETQFSTDEEAHLTRLFIDIYNSRAYLDLSNVSFGSLRECTVATPSQLEDVFKNEPGAIPPLYLRKLQMLLQGYGWEQFPLDTTLNQVDLAGLKTLAYPLPIESLAGVQPLPALERMSIPVNAGLSKEQWDRLSAYPKLKELRLIYGGNIEFSDSGLAKIRRRFKSSSSRLPPGCRLVIALNNDMHWFEKPIEFWTEGRDYLEIEEPDVESPANKHASLDSTAASDK